MFFSIISLMFAALCSREKQGTLSCGVYVYLYVCRLYMRTHMPYRKVHSDLPDVAAVWCF